MFFQKIRAEYHNAGPTSLKNLSAKYYRHNMENSGGLSLEIKKANCLIFCVFEYFKLYCISVYY